MALQRFSASSSGSTYSGSESSSSAEEPPGKKAATQGDPNQIRSLSWNQLQSLELGDQRTLH